MDVILVAVKKSKVIEYIAVVDQAGFNTLIVDVDSFALGNQWELNFPSEARETVALIDIGAAIMKTNVVRGGATIFARDIPFGGNNYTQAIAQRLKIPFEQAEAAKLGRGRGRAVGNRRARLWKRYRASCRSRSSGRSTTSRRQPSPSASGRSSSPAAARSFRG